MEATPIAISKTERSGMEQNMTTRSKVASWAALATLVVFLIWAVVSPHEASRIDLNQSRAVRGIETLNSSELSYASRHQGVGYACELAMLGEEGLVDSVLASGTRAGYRFEVRCVQGADQKVTGYTASAVPVTAGITGRYSFCTDARGLIWYSKIGQAEDCLARQEILNH